MAGRPKQLIAGSNLKMYKTNHETVSFACELQRLRADIPPERLRLFILPSFPALADVCRTTDPDLLSVGAQNIHWESEGPFTGEVSARMLADIGVRLVMVGHAERRHKFGDTDEQVNKRLMRALGAGFQTLLCVGDTLAEKQRGESERRLRAQTQAALNGCPSDKLDRLWIAYEPVWSIGDGGIPASPETADEMHDVIRTCLGELYPNAPREVPILYGGSVNQENAAELIRQPRIDGLFIGRAAWDAQNFHRILQLMLDM